MLEVSGLVVQYGNATAIDGVDLRVDDGEVVCVLGPSGSGKSTLLRAIAGLEPAVAGAVCWDRVDLAGTPPHRRRFGLMFQDHALFPHLDVAHNVAYGLRMRGARDQAARARATELLALVGLPGTEGRPVGTLSGGEQQRVALARALAPDPRLLMLDEPLGALDRHLRERLVDELRAIFARRERAVLLVTHDHEEAFAIADRVVVVRDGRVEQDGDAATVWQQPATAFVAEFLGYNVTTAFGRLVAVRPDGLRLTQGGAPTRDEPTVDWPNFAGMVVDRTFRRDHFRVRVRSAAGDVLDVAVPPTGAPDPGTAVVVAIDPETAIGLDA